MTTTVYDWRSSIIPVHAYFRAGGEAIGGGLTTGGFAVENPEPGGRAEYVMDFDTLATATANLDASWLISRILNRNVIRVPIFNSVQLVPASDLSGVENGQTWSNDKPWNNDENWAWAPVADVLTAANEGETSVRVRTPGQIIKIGHVVGFDIDGYSFAHVVMDVSYNNSNNALLTVSPPFRRDLTTSDQMSYRPRMMATCRNARQVASGFLYGRHVKLGSMQFVEALL